jgi:hypothetical protein
LGSRAIYGPTTEGGNGSDVGNEDEIEVLFMWCSKEAEQGVSEHIEEMLLSYVRMGMESCTHIRRSMFVAHANTMQSHGGNEPVVNLGIVEFYSVGRHDQYPCSPILFAEEPLKKA